MNTVSNRPGKPLLIFDGDCNFCRLWIERWRAITRERVDYAPFQEAAAQYPEIAREAFARSVQLILPSGEVTSAAQAVFRTLAMAPGYGWMLWIYLHVPGAALVSEWAYSFVEARRNSLYKLTRFLWGEHFERPSFLLARWLFVRLLGLAYLFAFLTLATQITGLIGQNGILPVGNLLELVRANLGPERYWYFPTLTWFGTSDTFLRFLTVGGVASSALVILGVATIPSLVIAWALYLSLVIAGQDFLSFQWDALLLEAGFLAILLAPAQLWPRSPKVDRPSSTVLWLLRLLLFRLMFSSGAVKLLSGDPNWRNFTALDYHYETQPLPTPVAWYMHLLPSWFHKASVGFVFLIELGIPFLIFLPRRPRFLAGGLLLLLQVLIALTGNYAYFNLLAIALCVLLFDDAALRRFFPDSWTRKIAGTEAWERPSRIRRWIVVPIACVVILAGFIQLAELFAARRLPRPALRFFRVIQPLHIVNSYGLFAIMTTTRPEIIIEGSNDGENWQAYEFKYKPGELRRAPRWVEPFQPRLDWQMWFAALGSYQSQPWFVNFALRLLQGSPEVLGLLEKDPFTGAPPRYLRAQLYEYHFTDWATRRKEGKWWRREEMGVYLPIIGLRERNEPKGH